MESLTSSGGPFPLPPNISTAEPPPGAGTMPDEGAQSDGLLRLVYQVDRALDAIAQQFPGVAGQIDTVKMSLQDVVATATRSGAAPPEKRGLSALGRDVRV